MHCSSSRLSDGDHFLIVLQAIIVDEKSATLQSWPCWPLALDHYNLNKFSDPEDGNWISLQNVILKHCKVAPAKLQARDKGRFVTVYERLMSKD